MRAKRHIQNITLADFRQQRTAKLFEKYFPRATFDAFDNGLFHTVLVELAFNPSAIADKETADIFARVYPSHPESTLKFLLEAPLLTNPLAEFIASCYEAGGIWNDKKRWLKIDDASDGELAQAFKVASTGTVQRSRARLQIELHQISEIRTAMINYAKLAPIINNSLQRNFNAAITILGNGTIRRAVIKKICKKQKSKSIRQAKKNLSD